MMNKRLTAALGAVLTAGTLAASPVCAAPAVEPGPAVRADFTADQHRFVVRLPLGVQGHGHAPPRRTIVVSALDAGGREIARLERTVSRRSLTVSFDAAELQDAARLVVSAP